jgi:hypothetical protein
MRLVTSLTDDRGQIDESPSENHHHHKRRREEEEAKEENTPPTSLQATEALSVRIPLWKFLKLDVATSTDLLAWYDYPPAG